MKTLKKILATTMIAAMVLGLAGCERCARALLKSSIFYGESLELEPIECFMG